MKYESKTKRIALEIPTAMKLTLESKIPPGTLSAVTRNLLICYLETVEKEGLQQTLKAVLNNNINLVLQSELENADS